MPSEKILNEKNCNNLLVKDFSAREISFTDSFMLGCYYSVNSPMYFSMFLCKNEFIDNEGMMAAYSVNDYGLCSKSLNKIINELELDDEQKGLFLNTFYKEWKLLDKDNSNINLLLVPRLVLKDKFNIEEFITNNKEVDFLDSVCKLLEQNENVVSSYNVRKEDITFVSLSNYKGYIKSKKKEKKVEKIKKVFNDQEDEFSFSGRYGKVSLLMLLGVLFIVLGVVLTFLMIG